MTGLLLALSACATHHPAQTAAAPLPVPADGGRDATGAYRFNMTQNGRKMTADEFDAWMKARGIRVAKGAPAAAPAADRATAQAKKPAQGRPKPALATTAKAKPKPAAAPVAAKTPAAPTAKAKTAPATATLAQAPKPKPKAKPVAKEVSEAKAPAKQGTSEG